MKILNRLLNLKKKYSLIRGDKDSKYIFTFHEKSLGAELNLFGYRSNVDEEIINLKDDMAQIKIGDCELWVQNELFKLGELSYIYNEIFSFFGRFIIISTFAFMGIGYYISRKETILLRIISPIVVALLGYFVSHIVVLLVMGVA